MSGSLIDNAGATWVVDGVNAVLQSDAVEGQAVGASHGGIGNSNAAQQVLANRTALLYGRQQTDMTNIGVLQGQVAVLQSIILPYEQALDVSGVFTVPANVTRIKIRVWGAGGGGGSAINGSGAGGGGGGGYAEGTFGVLPGQQYTVLVGLGGAGSLNPSQNGSAGGSTAFGGLISASGGQGGGSASGAGVSGGGPAGVGSGGAFSLAGSGGVGGISIGAVNLAGGGGAAPLMPTNAPYVPPGPVGFPGYEIGGGGTGGAGNVGGAGGNGVVVVEW